MDEMADHGIEACDLLGWEWEMGLHDTITERARRRGLDVRPRQIPREVMERQVTDADTVRFFELAHVDLDVRRQGQEACVVLKDFTIPSENLIPPKVRESIQAWSDLIDYWSVDFGFSDEVFHNQWQAYRTREHPVLATQSDWHEYPEPGRYAIVVKIIDMLVVIDGAKALRAAVRAVLGDRTPVQRCVRHKERNVVEHLPERDRPAVKRRLRRAWARDDHGHALDELRALAAELERSRPGAAASLREGLEETLTVTRLGVKGALKRTLESTNPYESMIECVRRSSRNVKRWHNGEMGLRWTAAGMLEAERQFRRIIGYSDLAKLAVTVERELTPPQPYPSRPKRPLSSPPPDITPGPPPRCSTPAGPSSEGGRPRHATDSARGARQRYGLAAGLQGEPEAAC